MIRFTVGRTTFIIARRTPRWFRSFSGHLHAGVYPRSCLRWLGPIIVIQTVR